MQEIDYIYEICVKFAMIIHYFINGSHVLVHTSHEQYSETH